MRNIILTLCFLLFAIIASAQTSANLLLGRWEMVRYSEQGLQVDKKQDPLKQAIEVYRHVQQERAKRWYGYDAEYSDEYSKRRAKEFERWEQRDSTKEVRRIAEAIATPYYAVFFPDSTLALYNKHIGSGRVSFQEAWQFIFNPATMSITLYPQGFIPPPPRGTWADRMKLQVISITADRLVLFIPEEAEVVELIRSNFELP